jgi:hypothetical protein
MVETQTLRVMGMVTARAALALGTPLLKIGIKAVDWPVWHGPMAATAKIPEVTVQKNSPSLGQDTIILTLPASSTHQFARLKVTR